MARGEGALFVGSTSSLSGILSHIYFKLSNHRPVDTSVLSTPFTNEVSLCRKTAPSHFSNQPPFSFLKQQRTKTTRGEAGYQSRLFYDGRMGCML